MCGAVAELGSNSVEILGWLLTPCSKSEVWGGGVVLGGLFRGRFKVTHSTV